MIINKLIKRSLLYFRNITDDKNIVFTQMPENEFFVKVYGFEVG
jgi:hypothetical protein